MKLYQLERQARRLPLPASQKAILTCLISYSNSNGDGTSIFPGLETICEETSLCRRTVQYGLRELEGAGWIVAVDRRGGAGRPSQYHLNLDQFGGLVARPVEQPAPAALSPQRQLSYARGLVKRLKLDSPARPKWLERVRELEALINLEPASELERVRRLPALLDAEAANLIPLQPGLIDERLRSVLYYWLDMLIRQRAAPMESRAWWQPKIEQARYALNHELKMRRIIAVDQDVGAEPIDTEIEAQMQAMFEIWKVLDGTAEAFKGLPDYLRIQAFTDEMAIAVNDLLVVYEQSQQQIEIQVRT